MVDVDDVVWGGNKKRRDGEKVREAGVVWKSQIEFRTV